MSTITLSPGLVSFLTDKVVANATATPTYNETPSYKHNLFTFNRAWTRSFFPDGQIDPFFETTVVQFKDAGNNILVRVPLDTFTRTQDGNGYIVFSGMPATLPIAAGEATFLAFDGLLSSRANYRTPTTTYAHAVTLDIDDTGTGADIELADRTIVTGQPWRMDGSFRFRIPSSYTYTL
jgi:hypothetical protein